jgi:DNA polymerase-3 subunit gamma/tau
MENFIVSARKYRPDNFGTVIGQPGITATLKSAIRSGHLAHAYLFCGPRGVGKTTCARILAKTINCINLGPDAEPCNHCESCSSFNESKSFNIHELDAASNNSVDDIRNLIDSVRIIPQSGKYSVYIIDEVHMLSQSAFNAFLKTLEEPPPHAVFILATTEKHKIIPTILSRCQIYDFNRIRVEDIAGYLRMIAGKEGVEAEEEALHIIALKADGAMRDALTIFDQLVSFSQQKITYSGVIENLNVLDYEYYFKITDCFLQQDVSNALLTFNEILLKGFDGLNFVSGLAGHFRDLLVSRDAVTLQLLESSESIRTKYLDQARRCETHFLFAALDVLNQCEISYRSSKNQRLHIEIALLKLCQTGIEKKNQGSRGSEELILPIPGKIVKEEKKQDVPIATEPKATVHYKREAVDEQRQIGEETSSYPRKIQTLSIKNALQQLEKADKEDLIEADSIVGNPDDSGVTVIPDHHPVDNQLLVKCWLAYAQSIQNEKPRFSSALKAMQPELFENHRLEVTFSNQVQLDAFNMKIKGDLENFLRTELQHPGLRILAKLLPPDMQQKKLYTSEEKLAYLTEKNPLLAKLKQDLGLELE